MVIPVWNQERYVGAAIESALTQSFVGREVVVVDDGSTDGTPAILTAYGSRITALRQENAGFAPALNRGIHASRGEYVAWLSSDDMFLPDKLSRQVALLANEPELDLIYTDFYEIDAEGRTLREVRSPWFGDQRVFIRQMLWNNFVNGSSVLMRRRAFEAVGGFPETPRFAADGLMWFRMLARGRFGHVAEPLVKYRVHPGQGSRDARALQAELAGYYRRALSLHPVASLYDDLAVGHRDVGNLLAYRRLTVPAVAQYARSLARAPARASTWVALVRALARAGRP